jgi:hypothetical protein
MSGLETTKTAGEGRKAKGEGGAREDLVERPLRRSPFALRRYAVKLLPHPQPPVAFGLVNVKPDPCIELT